MNRRTRSALLIFPIAFATGLIVFNHGRRYETTQLKSVSGEPGNLLEGDAFSAPAAQAMEVGDYQRALGYYLSALADAKTSEQRRTLADKLHALGISAHMRDKGQGSLSISAFEEAIRLYDTLGAYEEEATTLLDLSESRKLRGEQELAQKALAQAYALAEKVSDPGLRSNVLFGMADFKLNAGAYLEATTLYQKSLILREQVKNPEAIADCLTGLGRIASYKGHFDEAISYFTRSERQLAAIKKTATRAAVLGWHGDTLIKMRKVSFAEELYREGLAVWEQGVHQEYWTGFFLARLARVALLQKDIATAQQLAQKSLLLLRKSNGKPTGALPLAVLGDIAREENNLVHAESLHREALELCRLQQSPQGQVEVLETLIFDLQQQGKDSSVESLEVAQLRTKLSRLNR